MPRHLALGVNGEELAARYLEKKGLRIIERRVRFRRGELDLVARDGREWVFVEVKTRSHDRMGCACEAVSARKSRSLGLAVQEYVDLHDLNDSPIRCDLIAIDFGADGTPVISHYPAAFTW